MSNPTSIPWRRFPHSGAAPAMASAYRFVSTSSGANASTAEVSISPAWDPPVSITAAIVSGIALHHEKTKQKIPSPRRVRAASSRAAVLPPCPFTNTIRRTPCVPSDRAIPRT